MRSGIYLIQNIFNGRKYIGSSRSLSHRKACHFSELKNGYHGNHRLQKEYNEYGKLAFRWIVLEKCEIEELIEREQWWLDNLKPEYNILLKADNHTYTETEKRKAGRKAQAERMRGRKQSADERQRRSETWKKNWENPEWRMALKKKLKKSPEQVAELKSRTGKKSSMHGKKRPKEFKKLISNLFSSMEYTYISPTGKEVTFRNLTKFCKDNQLNYNAMRSLHQGRRKSDYNGWTFKSKKFIGYKKDRK